MYGINGQKLWVDLQNLHYDICDKDDKEAAEIIVAWCKSHVHPYYFYGDPYDAFDYNQEINTEFWDTIVNLIDERHEVDFMIDRLVVDTINDTTITVPGSILVYSVEQPGKKMCEFDGIIIHPMRPKNQVVFLEAKNTKAAPTYGKKCLQQKLKTLRIPFNDRDIAVINHDAFMNMTI